MDSNLQALIAAILDGLMLGFIYGISAMGLTLIFGVMRVINLAHGAVIALGMFGVFIGTTTFGLNPYVSLIFVMVLGLGFGILMYFISIHRVIDQPELTTLLATFSVSLMIIGLGTAAFTTTQRAVEVKLGTFQAGAITILGTRVVAALIAGAVTIGLYIFLYRTRIGKSIRAVANNRSAAELMGINTTWVLALSFGIGIMLATISGGLIATILSFTILSGGGFQLKSFVIVVLGGLGNPTGALLGGIILGLLEGLIPIIKLPIIGSIPFGWVPVIEYVIFILILLIRPKGLLGART
jgi:branched-subunit amino acid ABC-type transport system permease component